MSAYLETRHLRKIEAEARVPYKWELRAGKIGALLELAESISHVCHEKKAFPARKGYGGPTRGPVKGIAILRKNQTGFSEVEKIERDPKASVR